ncbi:MAG: MBOAT family O-acyltransferase [Planctomycetota bacterium]
MEFHSARFGLFLAVVLLLYWSLANRRGARYAVLLVASYVFYAGWELWFLSLIVFSTFLDYFCGRAIHASEDPRTRRRWLYASLGGNLAVLGYFKYSAWGADGLASLFAAVGLDPSGLSWVWRAAVPVGISFYTFQTLSYTIDIYRGKLRPARSFGEFALFVAFFPQLVAGPIVRAVQFLPQLDLRPRFDRARLHDGLYRIGTGLLKKVLLADVLGRYLVDPFYSAPESYAWWVHVLALYGFAFQIYGDFAGYSDVAIGAARLLGFDLPENFDGPYRSRSVREFWRRWHISLSSWVRDYIYFPLGGSRGSELKVARNLFVTMLIIAVWHGSSLLWVIYGLLQGGALVLERALERRRGGEPFTTTPVRSLVAWFAAFHFAVFTEFFIRAESLGQFGAVFGTSGEETAVHTFGLLALAGAFATHLLPGRTSEGFRARVCALPTAAVALLFGVACGLVAIAVVGETPFIYFQF